MNDVFTNKFSEDIFRQKYSMDGRETWAETADRVVEHVVGRLYSDKVKAEMKRIIFERKFIPAGRYLYSAGRPFHQVNNCFLFRAEDSREGWADVAQKAVSSLMTGGGIGVDYTDIRPNGYPVHKTGGLATGPLSVMHIVNESGRYVMQGGQRRSAIWAGLSWYHPDVLDFIKVKNWSTDLRALKERDFTFPAQMELTNISVVYDDIFLQLMRGTITNELALEKLIHRQDWALKEQSRYMTYVAEQGGLSALAHKVWELNVKQAFKTGEPGWSFNAANYRESLRNACTEVVSEDDSDKCNLGTVWMQAHEDMVDFSETIRLGTAFLLAGALYSHLPTDRIKEVGARNNRIGLGLGGMAEWLMLRGKPYEVDMEMRQWLKTYELASDASAEANAAFLGVAIPKGRRAIAPTGTIGIIAETTTGIEPLFRTAYLRRYFKEGKWYQQYVVDGAVKRLLAKGVQPEDMYDSYQLPFEQRVRFQADVQGYVDMSISSTVNVAPWGSEHNAEHMLGVNSDIILEHAESLRGLTIYPDGARGGQPLTGVDLETALANEGTVFEPHEHECVGGVCGL